MKRLLLAASLLLLAVTASAEWQTVLTDDNTLWSANEQSISVKLDLQYRAGDQRTSVRVPGTEDSVTESHPRLAWDSATRALFVMWRHGDEIRIARRSAAGEWSSHPVARGTALDGLQFVITRSSNMTLLHGAWWSGDTAEYALVAFEGAQVVSTAVVKLDELANIRGAAATPEDTGTAVHPPLAMTRAGDGVDVAYGAPRSTAVTIVNIRPEKIYNDARMWRPSGRMGHRSEPAGLTSINSAPVRSFIVEGRVVLYTPDSRFRYVVLENGRWTPIRMLALDETLTSEELVNALRRSVLEHGADNTAASQ